MPQIVPKLDLPCFLSSDIDFDYFAITAFTAISYKFTEKMMFDGLQWYCLCFIGFI